MMNIDRIAEKARHTVETHSLGDGAYARWLWQNKEGTRSLGINEYGCADAANILYTIGTFPRDEKQRADCIAALRSLQDADSGLFREATHHPIHTTAHCVASLELFDALPAHPLRDLEQFLQKDALYAKLDSLDWEGNPWPQSHQGAGLYAALLNADNAPLEWQDWYFGWLRDNCDPEYGMSKKGSIQTGTKPPSHHMCGWFHYVFNHVYAKRPIPHPEKLIDSCIEMYEAREMHLPFGRMMGFMEIDWVFCLNRASYQCKHRFDEVQKLLLDFAQGYIGYLDTLPEDDDGLNDLHSLFGAMCAVSELQIALPGQLRSTRPWKNVLDRRPFI